MSTTENKENTEKTGEVSTQNRPLKLMIKDEEVQRRFREMLGDNAPSFLMSVLNCVQNNSLLAVAEPQSVLMAAAAAAVLNMPIDPNLGMAYIIPYKDNSQGGKVFAQFQMGYKGFVALCHRTKDYHRINVELVYEGEIKNIDRLTGDIEWDWCQDNDDREKRKQIGAVAYFRLMNGFEKTFYLSVKQLEAHAKKYSQSYKKGFGQWKDNRVGMEKKTVLKLVLEKFAPKSIDMQRAIKVDQAMIGDYDLENVKYMDNQPLDIKAEDITKMETLKELFEQKKANVDPEDVLFIEAVIESKDTKNYDKIIYNLKKIINE